MKVTLIIVKKRKKTYELMCNVRISYKIVLFNSLLKLKATILFFFLMCWFLRNKVAKNPQFLNVGKNNNNNTGTLGSIENFECKQNQKFINLNSVQIYKI